MFKFLKAIYSLRKWLPALLLLLLIIIAPFLHLFYVLWLKFIIVDRITNEALQTLLWFLINFLLLTTDLFFLFDLHCLPNSSISSFYQERIVFFKTVIRGYYLSSCPMAFCLYSNLFYQSLKAILSYRYHPYSKTSLI